jgi:membrane fusion protein (multidrug efflux system)
MKALRFVIFLIILGALTWLGVHVFRSEEKPKEEDKEPVTEVAVKTAKLIRTTLHRAVSGYGLVEPQMATKDEPAALAKLTVPSSGLIAEVRCVEGQQVKKGDVLVTLDARAAQAKLDQANKAEEFATQESERQKKLLLTEGTSLKAAQEAENSLQKARIEVAAAETEMALLQIEAPISGTVTRVSLRAGEAAAAGAPAIEVLDPTRLSLSVRLPASEAAEIKVGQPVELLREGKPIAAKGVVFVVSPQVDSANGTVEVLVSLPAEVARNGEWIACRILGEERKDVLAAPIASVVKDKDDHDVIAIVEGDRADRTASRRSAPARGRHRTSGASRPRERH